MPHHRFDAYVDAARNGKNALWRIVLGVVIMSVICAAATIVIFCVGMAAILIRSGDAPSGVGEVLDAFDYNTIATDPAGPTITLLSVASLWIGVWAALKIVHRRSILDLFGTDRRLHWPDFVRSSVVTLTVVVATVPVVLSIDPTFLRGEISLTGWLIAVPPILVCCFLQTSAEELVFRGYLHQTLAARFARPIIWIGGPTMLFTLLHWESEASAAMNLAVLATILAFSLSMTHLLMTTGNLAAAMGAHFANNVSAFLLFSFQPDFGGTSLFVGRSVNDPGWTASQAALFAVLGVSTIVIGQILLLHRASPVRLRLLP